MNISLTAEEIRVMGCLLEKAVITPDQYPLTLNALTNACNQKSSRDPVMSLEPGLVQRTTRLLEEKYLLKTQEGHKSNVEKYSQRLCNTTLSKLKFSPDQYAVICLLMLRGPQTPGELRTRSGRLHEFPDNHAVAATLTSLLEREGGPVVARLPRRPGRQDHEYMHLFGGEIESVEPEVETVDRGTAPARDQRIQQLEDRVQALEVALKKLAGNLGEPLELDPPSTS